MTTAQRKQLEGKVSLAFTAWCEELGIDEEPRASEALRNSGRVLSCPGELLAALKSALPGREAAE
eukprot:5219293-Prymnesium_polylepis.1